MELAQRLHYIDYHESALTLIAETIIQRAQSLPDLTHTHIVLREPRLAPDIRQALLYAAQQQGHSTLLGAQIVSFPIWLKQFTPTTISVCDEQTRQLILIEALLGFPQLLQQANPWRLAESLLSLFDELTLNRVAIDTNFDQFLQQLATWYDTKAQQFSGLQQEARLIHQLWHAWHEQLSASGLTDPATAQIMAMQHSLEHITTDNEIHFVGLEPAYSSQQDWLHQYLVHSSAHLWLQGQLQHEQCLADHGLTNWLSQCGLPNDTTSTPTDYQHFLQTVFTPTPPLKQRAREIKHTYPISPLQEHIQIFSAKQSEQEAHAIDVQIRQWILEGKQRIGVVSENRLIARRLRALLERANVTLHDTTGWALSTTRTAATIESLLLCIEEDFAKAPLLDLLKSPLLIPHEAKNDYLKLIYRLERDIIQHEQISQHLARYQQAIHQRRERLAEIWSISPTAVLALLTQLEQASEPLREVYQQNAQPLVNYMEALFETLSHLDIMPRLAQDAAGSTLLSVLEQMHDAAKRQTFAIDWAGFRAWLGLNLESHYFQPQTTNNAVQLLSLNQTDFQQFDALIISSMEQAYLPGAFGTTPFFNSQVRQQLQLPTNKQFQATRLRAFYRLLHSAPSILLTHRQEQNAETIAPSPWLAAIQQFHQLAYDDDLQAISLHQLLQSQQYQVIRCDTKVLPNKQQQPKPHIPQQLVPENFSASSYQQLLDCPYQFFAAQCLALSAPEEIKQALSKREYGERIHQCLQAFHSDLARYPGPFSEPITETNRQAAIDLMHEITRFVFKEDMAENYLHRGWYHQWAQVIPQYIDWQQQQQQRSQLYQTELKQERELQPGLFIKGRLDRIDIQTNKQTSCIIDYKTGSLPKRQDIEQGEKIQLPFYALLAQQDTYQPGTAGYLSLGSRNQFREMFPLTEEQLSQLSQAIGERLSLLVQQLSQQGKLPAWEDDNVCRYCDMVSLCRCGSW